MNLIFHLILILDGKVDGKNNGLGNLWVMYPDEIGIIISLWKSPEEYWPGVGFKFSDEKGKAHIIGFMQNDEDKGKQYEWFSPENGIGLTIKGRGRLNRSIEAFLYCIAGAEVDQSSSIVGQSGGATNAQGNFLDFFEEEVIFEKNSTKRYQFAIQEAKLKLDFAIAPGLWLIPSNLILNTESVNGYNNNLKSATLIMKFGINESS